MVDKEDETTLFLRTEFDVIERVYAITGASCEFYAEDIFVGGGHPDQNGQIFKVLEEHWQDWSCCQTIADKHGNPCKCKRSPLGNIMQPRIIKPSLMERNFFGLREIK